MLKDDTWVCKQCCASNIQEKVWVKINSYQIIKDKEMAEVCSDQPTLIVYCPECAMDSSAVQYCDFAVDNNDEDVENNRLSQIISEADVAMNRFIKKTTEEGNK